MRIFLPIGFLVIFVGWVLYRLLIKKDLQRNRNNFYLGLFFIIIWVLIYFLWV
jgi:hypothetical protein